MPVLCREVQDGAGCIRKATPFVSHGLRRSCYCPSGFHTATLALQVRLSISLNVVDLVANYRHLAG